MYSLTKVRKLLCDAALDRDAVVYENLVRKGRRREEGRSGGGREKAEERERKRREEGRKGGRREEKGGGGTHSTGKGRAHVYAHAIEIMVPALCQRKR